MEQCEESVITIEMMNGLKPWREEEQQIVVVGKVTNISGTHNISKLG